LLAEIGEGIRWVWRQHLIRALVAMMAAGNLVFAALPLTLIVRLRDLGASPATIGLVFGTFGIGAILGALVAPRVQRTVPSNVVLIGSLWVWAVHLALFAVSPSAALIAVVWVLAAPVGPVFNVVVAAYRYALVPDRMQGRTNGVVRLVAWGTIPVGTLVAGFSLERFGAVSTLYGLFVLGAVIALVAMDTAHIRHAPPLS